MENFVVSARKYRPATFNTVVGQSHITQTLKNAIARGQLSHAYLFTGPRGVGKTTCARIFAKAINCLQPTAEFEACGVCESCVAFDSGRSFNIHELDAASNNSVDDIRALNEKVRIAPQVGKYSLYIIDEVHMLSTGAFNAFLKTLEEPPAYAIFILATTEKHKILPTILSRCQSYDFRRIRVDDIVEYLRYIAAEEGVTSDQESLHLIAAKADGGMRDALSTFDRVVSFCGKNLVYDQVASCIGSLDYSTYFTTVDYAITEDFAGALMVLDEVLARGFEGHQFVGGLLEHIRNLIVASNASTVGLLEATGGMVELYKAQSMKCGLDFLMNAMNLVSQADAGYRAATNRRLHTELALIKLCGLKKKEFSIADSYPLTQIVVGGGTSAVTVPSNTPSAVSYAVPTPSSTPTPVSSSTSSTSTSVTDVVNSAGEATSSSSTTAATATATAVATNSASAGGRVSRISISNLGKRGDGTSGAASAASMANVVTDSDTDKAASTQSPEKVQEILTANFGLIIDLWQSKHRPRIATALMSNRIAGNTITVSVPDQGPEQELLQNKLQIERDILDTLGVAATLVVVVVDTPMAYTPVSLEQKLQHLVDLNPKILRLREELDLTV